MKRAGIVVLFAILAILYLWPGPEAMFDRRTDTVMSDGTDGITNPYSYGVFLDTWRHKPSNLLYGAVFAPTLNAPDGYSLWAPLNERWLAVVLSPALPLEQMSTGVAYVLLIINALAMYAAGRRMGWSRSLSIAMAIAYAFTAYTRGRAKVHMSMTGVYHLPLAFLGILLVIQAKNWKSTAAAAACFLGAVTVVHYYIITMAFLSPFLLAFALVMAGSRSEWPRMLPRLAVAVVPAVALVGWCYLKPLPPGVANPATIVVPGTGDAKPGQMHPFLNAFAAHPIDYFAGDVALGSSDWNPIRGAITSHVLSNLGESNPHERANGIRWSVWLFAILGLVAAWHPRTRVLWPEQTRRLFVLFAIFAAFSMWLSLSPDFPIPRMGPSYWLYSLVSQIRVPSRAGVCATFGIVMMAGLFFHQVFEVALPAPARKKDVAPRWPLASGFKWLATPALLPLIMIVDLPPLVQDLPMSPVKPVYSELQQQGSGAGLYFPYVSGNYQLGEYYYFLQQMRGTQVQILNAAFPDPRNSWFLSKMPLQADVVTQINGGSTVAANILERLKSCVPLTWIVFDRQIQPPARQSLCAGLGWTLSPDGVCRAADLAAPIKTAPEHCF